MRKHSDFTQEEMRILKENPNTAKLTENRISLTLDTLQILFCESFVMHAKGQCGFKWLITSEVTFFS